MRREPGYRGVVAVDHNGGCAAPVHGDMGGLATEHDGTRQRPAERAANALGLEQKADALADAIERLELLCPLSTHLDANLIRIPPCADGSSAPTLHDRPWIRPGANTALRRRAAGSQIAR